MLVRYETTFKKYYFQILLRLKSQGQINLNFFFIFSHHLNGYTFTSVLLDRRKTYFKKYKMLVLYESTFKN